MSLRLTKEENIVLKHLLIEYNLSDLTERETMLSVVAFRAAKKLFKNPKLLDEIRTAFADFIRSEGCSCCQDVEEHKKAAAKLAELLEVPRYSDGFGYNFALFATPSNDQ